MASRITGTSGVFRLEPQATLTSRERLILQGLWSGKNTSQISEEFGFSVNAVKALRHQLDKNIRHPMSRRWCESPSRMAISA